MWQLANCWKKKLRGHSGKKMHGDLETIAGRERWGSGCRGHDEKERNVAQSWNQIQTLKNYIYCHMYCAHFSTALHQIVGDMSTVPSRESRYPRPGSLSGYFSRTRFSCSHMVVKTILYCTRKCGCKGGCMSAAATSQRFNWWAPRPGA